MNAVTTPSETTAITTPSETTAIATPSEMNAPTLNSHQIVYPQPYMTTTETITPETDVNIFFSKG